MFVVGFMFCHLFAMGCFWHKLDHKYTYSADKWRNLHIYESYGVFKLTICLKRVYPAVAGDHLWCGGIDDLPVFSDHQKNHDGGLKFSQYHHDIVSIYMIFIGAVYSSYCECRY